MKKMSFHEYLNSKDKLDKPVVDISGDRVDPMQPPVKPPHGPNYKYSDGKPRKAGQGGFANAGDKKLVYKPDVDQESKGKTPAKIPTVNQVEVASIVADGIVKDPTLLEEIVRQIKRKGMLGALVAEAFDHRDSYTALAQIMNNKDHGPKTWNSLAFALHEEVAAPFSSQLDAEDEEESDDDSSDDHGDDQTDLDDPDGQDHEPDNSDPANDQNPDAGMDPGMMGDPNMMGMDPNMMGMDPNMAGAPPMSGPGMNPMGAPPMNPLMSAMQKFQRAMMRSYQREMMRKNMRKK